MVSSLCKYMWQELFKFPLIPPFQNLRLIVAFPSIKGADTAGFHTGVENMGGSSPKFDGGGGLKSIHGGSMGGGLNAVKKYM